LKNFLDQNFKKTSEGETAPQIRVEDFRKDAPEIPQFSVKEIVEYYEKLGKQNLSPDDGIYPLGSCTMKYNPYINDYAANQPPLVNAQPRASAEDARGCWHILYETQEMLKAIPGLPGVVTPPLAGAPGEQVGLDMFQGYPRDREEGDTRNVIIFPRPAH